MPYKPLRDTSLSDANQVLSKAQAPLAKINQRFMDGDHFQDGEGWIGPWPGAHETGAAEVRNEIKRGFVSRNAIAEVVHRHKNGVMGREPAWNFTTRRPLKQDEKPKDTEQALIDAAEAAMTGWWDKRKVHKALQQAVEYGLHQGRGVVRIFFPRGRAVQVKRRNAAGEEETVTVVQAPTLEEALDQIFVDTPHPSKAAVMEDSETMQEVGIYSHKSDDKDILEVTYSDGFGKDAMTTLRVEVSADNTVRTFTYPLGGRLLMAQVERPPLVSEQVVEQQKALNLAETMIPRTVTTGGFLERIILNAQMPGEWVNDPNSPTGRRFQPAPFYTGHGTTNFLAGKEYRELDGSVRIANPSVFFRDPVSPKPSIEAGDAHRMHILNETDQTHVSIAGDAFASAVSRVEAKTDYLSSLRTTQTSVEAVGRWLIETVFALAVEIVRSSGGTLPAPDMMDQLKAEFRCRLQVGHITPEEQRAIKELVEGNLISREDAMTMLGTDNVDDALAKINSQPGAYLDISEQQAKVFKAWLDTGAPEEFAATMAKLTPEQVAELKRALATAPADPAADPAVQEEDGDRPPLRPAAQQGAQAAA